jgi:hypothetical protein
MKCTQYEICEEVAYKNIKAMVFMEVKQIGQRFLGGTRKSRFFCGANAPHRLFLPPKACRE